MEELIPETYIHHGIASVKLSRKADNDLAVEKGVTFPPVGNYLV